MIFGFALIVFGYAIFYWGIHHFPNVDCPSGGKTDANGNCYNRVSLVDAIGIPRSWGSNIGMPPGSGIQLKAPSGNAPGGVTSGGGGTGPGGGAGGTGGGATTVPPGQPGPFGAVTGLPQFVPSQTQQQTANNQQTPQQKIAATYQPSNTPSTIARKGVCGILNHVPFFGSITSRTICR
jgi:hypothetical protein